jgi:O-antigen ligase
MDRLASAQAWTLRVGAFALPLAYSPFTYDSFVLPKLLLARLLVVVLLVLVFARVMATGSLVVKRTPLDIPLAAFLASAALSTVFAENLNVALFGTYGRYDGVFTLLTFAALFWLSVQGIADQAEARVLLRVLLASGYAVGGVAIVQSIHDSVQQGYVAPAFGTLGNPNVLGAFLALVISIAAGEFMMAGSAAGRILFLNLLIVTGAALVLTFSRSSWLAACAGIVFVVLTRPKRIALALVAPLVVVLVLVVTIGQLDRAFLAKVRTLIDLQAIAGSRLGIWADSIRLIASRPILGYGPDNVGLVFPRFQTGDWSTPGQVRQPIDKAHAELLQVAATQGLVGVVTYVFLLVAFVRAFWRAARLDQAVLVVAGWIGYQVSVQLNFTALASALPFWIFAAAAMASSDAVRSRTVAVGRRPASLTLVLAGASGVAVTVLGVIAPFAADAVLRAAVEADYAGRPQQAQVLAAEARQLGPRESVYAVEVGNTAFELSQWAAARAAYRDAAALGTFNALVYRNLALADRDLGLLAEGKDAARKAVELDRFDPANQAVLAQYGGGP